MECDRQVMFQSYPAAEGRNGPLTEPMRIARRSIRKPYALVLGKVLASQDPPRDPSRRGELD